MLETKLDLTQQDLSRNKKLSSETSQAKEAQQTKLYSSILDTNEIALTLLNPEGVGPHRKVHKEYRGSSANLRGRKPSCESQRATRIAVIRMHVCYLQAVT